MLGDIYKGKVKKIMKSFDFAFIDIGTDKMPIMKLNGRKVNEGEELICQFIKLPIEDKGGEVTEHFSVSNDYFVIIAGDGGLKVSDKIINKDLFYNEFKDFIEKNQTVIIRTESENISLKILYDNLKELKQTFNMIKNGIYLPIGSLLYKGKRDEVKPFEGKAEFFLPSKGLVTFERTKAFVSIDIDSKNANDIDKRENMAYIINRESLVMIFEKLSELNIVGIIVADLLKCVKEEYDELLKLALELSKADKENINVYGITKLGLLEMTRNFKR